MTAVAPVMLKNMQQICEAFGKSRKTIIKWRTEGAPIFKDGGVYGAELNAVAQWLVERGSKIAC